MALDKAFDKLRYGIEEDHRTARTRNRRASMHAALIHLTIDPALAAAAAARFTSEILPRVRAAPGFVAGYWVDPVYRQALVFPLSETEEQPLGATPPPTPCSAPGVTLLRTDVRRVAVPIP